MHKPKRRGHRRNSQAILKNKPSTNNKAFQSQTAFDVSQLQLPNNEQETAAPTVQNQIVTNSAEAFTAIQKEIVSQGKLTAKKLAKTALLTVPLYLVLESLAWLKRSMRRMLGWRTFECSAVVLTLFGALFFLPRVVVNPPDPYDPSHPTPLRFTIANTNVIPLYDVDIGIGLCYIIAEHDGLPIKFRGAGSGDPAKEPPVECDGPATSILERWRVRWLDVDERLEIPMEELLDFGKGAPNQIERANITVAVKYRPWGMPWPFISERQFRFITKRLSDGRIYWMPTPLRRIITP